MTRADFDRKCAEAAGARKLRAGAFAIVALPLGVAQFLFIHWANQHARPDARLPLELGLWTTYLALVAFLWWRMGRAIARARPRCPSCRRLFDDASARAVSARGACDRCGAALFE